MIKLIRPANTREGLIIKIKITKNDGLQMVQLHSFVMQMQIIVIVKEGNRHQTRQLESGPQYVSKYLFGYFSSNLTLFTLIYPMKH